MHTNIIILALSLGAALKGLLSKGTNIGVSSIQPLTKPLTLTDPRFFTPTLTGPLDWNQ